MKYIFLMIIKFYQFFVSPWMGRNCRYFPTCSEYAKDALNNYGVICGLFFIIKRVLSCNPFSDGGYDPVIKKTSDKDIIS